VNFHNWFFKSKSDPYLTRSKPKKIHKKNKKTTIKNNLLFMLDNQQVVCNPRPICAQTIWGITSSRADANSHWTMIHLKPVDQLVIFVCRAPAESDLSVEKVFGESWKI
jgi:hypothetical protein